jgi:hypothetical protein
MIVAAQTYLDPTSQLLTYGHWTEPAGIKDIQRFPVSRMTGILTHHPDCPAPDAALAISFSVIASVDIIHLATAVIS